MIDYFIMKNEKSSTFYVSRNASNRVEIEIAHES